MQQEKCCVIYDTAQLYGITLWLDKDILGVIWYHRRSFPFWRRSLNLGWCILSSANGESNKPLDKVFPWCTLTTTKNSNNNKNKKNIKTTVTKVRVTSLKWTCFCCCCLPKNGNIEDKKYMKYLLQQQQQQ